MRPEIIIAHNMMACLTQSTNRKISLECFGCPAFHAYTIYDGQMILFQKKSELRGNYTLECRCTDISEFTAMLLLNLMNDGDDSAFDLLSSLVSHNKDEVFDFLCESMGD